MNTSAGKSSIREISRISREEVMRLRVMTRSDLLLDKLTELNIDSVKEKLDLQMFKIGPDHSLRFVYILKGTYVTQPYKRIKSLEMALSTMIIGDLEFADRQLWDMGSF
jgi:hypothetical protein